MAETTETSTEAVYAPFYALTRSKNEICLPGTERYSIKTLCGKNIKTKVEGMARKGRLKNMKLCSSCKNASALENVT